MMVLSIFGPCNRLMHNLLLGGCLNWEYGDSHVFLVIVSLYICIYIDIHTLD